MKVLVVAPSMGTRGGITSVVRLHMETSAWAEMNCEHLPTHEDQNIWRKMWVAIRSYAIAPFKIGQADAVHLHLAGEISFLRKLPIAVVARLLGKPYIAHIHASGPESLFERTPRWATRTVLKNAERTIALSDSWAEVIRKNVPAARVEVIPNPVRSFAPREATGSKVILFAGKLESRKGYRTLLEAIPLILEVHPDAHFVFAGHGELLEAQQIAAELGIAGSVQILGWVSQEELGLQFANAAVYCLPSRNEGVPMSVLEAMSRGVPVVCTPVGGLPEIIDDGRNGIFAAVDDPASLSRGILKLLADGHYAAAIGNAGRDTVNTLCSLEQVDKRLSRLYTEVHLKGVSGKSRLAQVPR